MKTQTDRELIAAVTAGDTDAFAGLVSRYRDNFTRYAVRMLGSREDADDVLQLAFIRAFKALRTCHEPDRFAAWLFQIVVNECRTYGSRTRSRELRFVSNDAALEKAPAEESPSLGGMGEEIESALAKLPGEQREAFLLKHVEEKSYEEIAELTGVGVSALKMRVKRACDNMRGLLEGVYHG